VGAAVGELAAFANDGDATPVTFTVTLEYALPRAVLADATALLSEVEVMPDAADSADARCDADTVATTETVVARRETLEVVEHPVR